MNGKGFWIGFGILAVVSWMVISYGARSIAESVSDQPAVPVIVTQ